MSFLDKVFPFFVGKRTEILAFFNFALALAQAFGANIPKEAVDVVHSVSTPLMVGTLAAKVSRK